MAVNDLIIVLDPNNGDEHQVSLAGRILGDLIEDDCYSIWTISSDKRKIPDDEAQYNKNKLKDLQWLADQGRNLLSLEDWSEILYQASQALQEKLGNCYVITLMMADDYSVQLEGVYGIENRILNQAGN